MKASAAILAPHQSIFQANYILVQLNCALSSIERLFLRQGPHGLKLFFWTTPLLLYSGLKVFIILNVHDAILTWNSFYVLASYRYDFISFLSFSIPFFSLCWLNQILVIFHFNFCGSVSNGRICSNSLIYRRLAAVQQACTFNVCIDSVPLQTWLALEYRTTFGRCSLPLKKHNTKCYQWGQALM